MADKEFDDGLLEEIEGIIDLGKEFLDKRSVPIIFDGKQYTIKIPKKLAVRAAIKDGDMFEFSTSSKSLKGEQKTEMTGRLKKVVANKDGKA